MFRTKENVMGDNHVWVALIVRDGVSDNCEYRGRLERETFDRIVNNELTQGWFKMEATFWERDRRYVPQGEAGYEWGYSNTTYYRAEWISRIIPLTEDFVAALLRQRSTH